MEHLELTFESGERSLDVLAFHVTEAFDSPFEAIVSALSPQADLDLDALVGKKAGLRVTGTRAEIVWTGVCAHAAVAATPSASGSEYTLVIVPDLWRLTLRSGHRIFQHASVPDIAEALLGEWGIEPVMKLDRASFPKHEYRVQYGESDFAFVSRLLEDAGISYFFAVDASGGTATSKLVLCDAPEKGEARAGPLTYAPQVVHDDGRDFAREARIVRASRPGRVTRRDFDMRRRDYELFGRSEAQPPPEGALEQYAYEPGGFLVETSQGGDTPVADDKSIARHLDKEGKARADRALHAAREGARSVAYTTSALDLRPGVVFVLDEHPSREVAGHKRLLVRRYQLEGTRKGRWTVRGDALPAAAPRRPPRRTPKPHIAGLQSAIVVGPPGQEIYTDEFGRVRLRFHWDREGAWDDRRTPWVRVSQHWAGPGYGEMMIPRVGQEVLVSFFEGDPDQPLVVGRVHDATAPVPYPLPRHKTVSTWKSATSPRDDGYNEIKLEDQAGHELLYEQAQKDLVKLVKNDETETTGHDQGIVVGNDRSASIGAVDTTTVGERHLVNVIAANDLKIEKQEAPDVTPKDTRVEMIDRKITITTGDATIVLEGPDITVTANENVVIRGKEVVIQGGPEVYVNCTPPDRLELARALVDVVGSADKADGELVARELAKMPRHVLLQLQKQGTRVKVCRGSVTDYLTDLKGVHPRGWPPGATWDNVPGLQTNNEVVIATIGHGTPAGAHVPQTGEGHGSYNMVIHETFHAVDLGGGPSRSAGNADYNTARNADLGTLSQYEQQPGEAGQQETYAESAARYYGGDPNDAAQHPNLHQYWSTNPILQGRP